jgi:hypothetical protein
VTIDANADAARPAAATDRFARWAVALFFVTIFLPGFIQVGVSLPLYRLLLIVLTIPMLLRFRADPTLRINAVDVLVFLAIFWRSLAIVVNHQMDQALNAVSSFIDLFFAYMFGRVFVRNAEEFRYFFRCFLFLLLAILPFALVENVFRQRLLRELSGMFLNMTDGISDDGSSIRFGLLRAQTAFEHPILFGNFCATAISNVYYAYWRQFPRNVFYAAFASMVTLTAISLSSIMTIVIQLAMIAYERVLRPVWFKWYFAAFLAVFGWFLFQMVVGRSFLDVLVNDLSLHPYGSSGRIEIFVYGMQNVYAHPIFGIGLNDWVRPFWRESPSMDNHWLFFAVRYGLPAFLFLLLAYVVQFVRLFGVGGPDEDLRNIRTGYAIALFAQVLMLATHATWGTANAFIMVYLGIGVWIWESARREAEEARLRIRAERAGRPTQPVAGGTVAGGTVRPRPAAGSAGRSAIRSDVRSGARSGGGG